MSTINQLSDKYQTIYKKLIPDNKRYIEDFLKSPNGKKSTYKSTVFLFAETFATSSFENLTSDDVEQYIESSRSKPDTIINKANHLIDFFQLIPSQSFNIPVLRKIIQEKNKETTEKAPLSLKEIIEFRNKLINSEDNKVLFIFEMLYIHRLEWKELENMKREDYLLFTNEMLVKSKEKIQLSEKTIEIINKEPNVLNGKIYREMANQLKNASQDFSRSVTQTEIKKTWEKYFPVCQRCDKQFPNTAEYWALVECKEDLMNKKWLLCLSCASEIGEKQE